MSRIVFVSSVLLLCALVLSACGSPAPAAAPTAPASAATSAPARDARTPLAQPAQPTVPSIAPRAATPYASPTFSSILNFPAATAAATATRVQAAATAAPGAEAGPTAPGVATGIRSELKVEFVAQLSTAEEVDDLRLTLMRIPGILSVAGNELAITIVYDAGLILPNQIRARLASIGHPVKP
ncbi:MAG: hypothetical protein HYR71_03760 [Chloroflexi bacterium]|nr:hypothetical protein [Chloroflexota bacterium]